MGSYITTIFKRLFHFPIQRKPICYYRQEDFSSTGVPLLRSKLKKKASMKRTDLDDFQMKFYSNLLRERRLNREQKGRSSSMKQSVRDYPGWDETTLSNIHSLFLLFNNRENGMLNFINFSAILESLGDTNTYEEKRKHFDLADSDKDGWLSYDDFVKLMFYMNPIDPDTQEITGVARLCRETADNIKFVTSLRVGEQLEYGLF
ncbi:uncharacterized protein LOC123682634 [Harmonia axyridis]|uniref:uncharacterized protein LOC123682634 n=1 Tax=Harmonia axyridis TaxID=115357 RepID=UPI001E2769AC|nr:uncharacterized protein LOC123682634 [Harmonia axyridis]